MLDWLKRLVQGCILVVFLVDSENLAARTLAELLQQYPKDNIRLGVDVVGWSQSKPNFAVGYRRNATLYSLIWQQGSLTEDRVDYDYSRLGLDLKRYFLARGLTTRLSINRFQLDAKNAFDSFSSTGWELQPQLGYRYFIEQNYWFEVFAGASFKVIDSPILKDSPQSSIKKGFEPALIRNPEWLLALEFSYEWRLFE